MAFGEIDTDLACLLIRLIQIDREQTPQHYLWQTRVMECDVPRLRAYLSAQTLEQLDRISAGL